MNISPTAAFLSEYGTFKITSFQTEQSRVHIAMLAGYRPFTAPPLVRIQSACMTSTALGGIICDCAEQVKLALKMIASAGEGAFLYLDEEGRGMGLFNKVIAMAEMNQGADTVSAFTSRGLSPDIRNYNDVGAILSALGIEGKIKLVTNNPRKIDAISQQGFEIIERIPIEVQPTDLTHEYLITKKEKLGHLLTTV